MILIYHLPKIFNCTGQRALSGNKLCLISATSLQILYATSQMMIGVIKEEKENRENKIQGNRAKLRLQSWH
jgi:hypothetical protein